MKSNWCSGLFYSDGIWSFWWIQSWKWMLLVVTDILTTYVEFSVRVKCSWWGSSESVDSRQFLHRLSKHQSPPTTVHLRIPLTWIIRISLKVCHPGFKLFSVLILMVSYFFQFCCTAVLGKENKVDKQIKKGEMLQTAKVSHDPKLVTFLSSITTLWKPHNNGFLATGKGRQLKRFHNSR